MKTLRTEEVHLAGHETFDAVAACLPRFIAAVDHTRRLHSAPGCRSPAGFEARLARQAARI